MEKFKLVISSPTSTVYNGETEHCAVFTPLGKMGLEARHEAILAVLQSHTEIAFRDETGADRNVAIENGLLSFADNVCTVTVGLPGGGVARKGK